MRHQKAPRSLVQTAAARQLSACSAASLKSEDRAKGKTKHHAVCLCMVEDSYPLTTWHLSYIKELADRINSIEGKLGGGVDNLEGGSRRESTEAFSSPLPIDDSRKRPFSSISNDGFPTPSPARPTAWTPGHRPIQPYQPPPNRGTPYSVNGLAPQPIGPKADPPMLDSQVADSMQLDSVMGELNEVTWHMYDGTLPMLLYSSKRQRH